MKLIEYFPLIRFCIRNFSKTFALNREIILLMIDDSIVDCSILLNFSEYQVIQYEGANVNALFWLADFERNHVRPRD